MKFVKPQDQVATVSYSQARVLISSILLLLILFFNTSIRVIDYSMTDIIISTTFVVIAAIGTFMDKSFHGTTAIFGIIMILSVNQPLLRRSF